MKRRSRPANALAAAVIASLALLPLYGDPRPSPVTHPDWARMMLRGLDLLDSTPLLAQASQVFATLSWKNSLAYRADRYVTAAGVQVEGTGDQRRVLASAEVGEVAYPIAVARGGDYRVRLLLSGDPALPAEAEIRAVGVVGGVIPPQDWDGLKKAGAEAIFPPVTVIADAAQELLHSLNRKLGHAREASE